MKKILKFLSKEVTRFAAYILVIIGISTASATFTDGQILTAQSLNDFETSVNSVLDTVSSIKGNLNQEWNKRWPSFGEVTANKENFISEGSIANENPIDNSFKPMGWDEGRSKNINRANIGKHKFCAITGITHWGGVNWDATYCNVYEDGGTWYLESIHSANEFQTICKVSCMD